MAPSKYEDKDYRELQDLAQERDIPANQSTEELIAALEESDQESPDVEARDTTSGRSSTVNSGQGGGRVPSGVPAGEPLPGVESGIIDDSYTEDQFKADLVQAVNNGGFAFNEEQARFLVRHFGLEEEVDDRIINTSGTSATAGAVPPLSGGVPYEPEAATEQTIEAAQEAQDRIDEGNGSHQDKALVAAVDLDND